MPLLTRKFFNKKAILQKMKRTRKILMIFFGVAAATMIALTGCYFFITADTKLQPNKLTLSKSCITVYDNKGIALDTPYEVAALETLPPHLPAAFIAIEDKRFYTHNGLDYRRILKALAKNVATRSFREGASTISQQLIKNTHLTNEKTLQRKIREWKLVRQLERHYSKQEILELYLNSIYFGHSAFGIENAAQFYFGKHAECVTPEESAMLAALVKSPNSYSPFRNAEKCLTRRNYILSLMQEQGYLNEAQTKKAKKTPLPKTTNTQIKNCYLDLVYEELEAQFPDAITTGKQLHVYTNLDTSIQSQIEKQETTSDVCRIILNNQDCGICAFYSTCGMMKRQPASTIKPLAVYAPAIEEKILSPATPILDEPIDFGGYTPSNADRKFHGYVSARQAIAKSINVPAVKTLNTLTTDTAAEYLKKMDMEICEQDKTLALALGGMYEGFTLLQLTNGYATFAKNGNYQKSAAISTITDESGNVIFQNAPQMKSVFSADTAYLISDTLHTAAKEGTAKKLKKLPYFVCAKTGTSEGKTGNTNAYAIAYTTQHTVGVWYGNQDNSPIPETGGGKPTNDVLHIFNHLYRNAPPCDFTIPNSIQEILLDSEEYEKNHRLVCADQLAPTYLTKKELFRSCSIPDVTSSRFSHPTIKKPTISVINGSICIELCQTQYYDYLIKRKNDDQETVIYHGKFKSKIYDNSISNNVRYTYVITPYFQKIEGESITLPSIYIQKQNTVPNEWWNKSVTPLPLNR